MDEDGEKVHSLICMFITTDCNNATEAMPDAVAPHRICVAWCSVVQRSIQHWLIARILHLPGGGGGGGLEGVAVQNPQIQQMEPAGTAHSHL